MSFKNHYLPKMSAFQDNEQVITDLIEQYNLFHDGADEYLRLIREGESTVAQVALYRRRMWLHREMAYAVEDRIRTMVGPNTRDLFWEPDRQVANEESEESEDEAEDTDVLLACDVCLEWKCASTSHGCPARCRANICHRCYNHLNSRVCVQCRAPYN